LEKHPAIPQAQQPNASLVSEQQLIIRHRLLTAIACRVIAFEKNSALVISKFASVDIASGIESAGNPGSLGRKTKWGSVSGHPNGAVGPSFG